MVSNLVVRNHRTGYVTFVAKKRVGGSSRTVEYICGLGTMTQEEFKRFQKWAHSMKDQQMRRDKVLACPLAVEAKEKATKEVATVKQKKTTVKRPPKEQKKTVKRYFPLPKRSTTHTEMMMERHKQEKVEAEMRTQLKPVTKKWKPKPWFEPGMGKK